MSKPLILVTNDDGIVAPGIRALVEVAQTLGDVVVVAPDSPQSGQGHAVTLRHPLRLNKVNVFEGVESWESSGTPVDCVKLAKHVVLKDRPFDLCVSGINHGSNASINILYSGTLSAAMEASIEGVKSIGFSYLDSDYEADFSELKPWIKKIMEFMLSENEAPGTLINVNLPKVRGSQIKGIKICRQAEARWIEEFAEGTDPSGQPYYWLAGKFVNFDKGTDSDLWALDNQYISVVPSMHDLTDHQSVAALKSLETQTP
jgi:5'-nucleotidase